MLDMQPTQISPPMMISPSIRSFLRDSLPTRDRPRFPSNQQPSKPLHFWLMLLNGAVLASMGSVASAEAVPIAATPNVSMAMWDGQNACIPANHAACAANLNCLEPEQAAQQAQQAQQDSCATNSIGLLAIAEPERVPLSPYAVTSPSLQPEVPAMQISDRPADTHPPASILPTPIPPSNSVVHPPSSFLFPPSSLPPIAATPSTGQSLDLKPEVIENSPLLQRWLREIPDITSEITNSPSFRTRLRLGYSQFPSTNQSSGINVGLDDVFLGRSGFTVSGDYYSTLNGQRQAWGADLHYYLRPLGSYINIAPVVGYRRLDTTLYSTDGLNLGLRLVVVLSRGGGADFSLTQTWLAPGSDREVGILNFSAGYALTSTLRLSADVQQQNARQRQDSRAAIVLEWLL